MNIAEQLDLAIKQEEKGSKDRGIISHLARDRLKNNKYKTIILCIYI